MIIDLSRDSLTGQGLDKGYSDQGYFGIVVYHPHDRSKVIKIFKQHERAHEIFESEVGAYTKAMQCPDINRRVASFYGTCCITSVLDDRGNDLSAHYSLDCAYTIKYYSFAFEKLNDYACRSDSNSNIASRLAGDFAKNGLSISDASYCFKEDGSILLIDFHLYGSTP